MKLNLGAGGTRIDGFTSVDLDPELKPDIIGDFRAMSFADVDEIYASHVLEHFFSREAEQILSQWCGWLKPGGILWIAVPDLTEVSRLVAAGETEPHILGLLYGADERPEWAHRSGWTEQLLTLTLEAAGFRILGRFDCWVQNMAKDGADWSGAWHRAKSGQETTTSLNLKAMRVMP